MNRQILHWTRLRDGHFVVKVRVSLMCVGFWNSFRMTGSGKSNSPSQRSESPQEFQSPLTTSNPCGDLAPWDVHFQCTADVGQRRCGDQIRG